MKRSAIITVCVVVVGIAWTLVGRIYVCVPAASHRWNALSSVGICPAFVQVSNAELQEQFGSRVHPGDTRQTIEAELARLGVTYSWDPYQNRYQGIRRAAGSNFHAVVVYVYADANGGFRSIEIEDSFTAP